jgi:hypothetical protein
MDTRVTTAWARTRANARHSMNDRSRRNLAVGAHVGEGLLSVMSGPLAPAPQQTDLLKRSLISSTKC